MRRNGRRLAMLVCTALIAVVNLSPSSLALTEPPGADGDTNKTDSDCRLLLAWPVSQDIIHTDWDSVRLSIESRADDDRTSGYGLHNYFSIVAVYQGSSYGNAAYIVTNPGDDKSDTFYRTVPNVRVSTYMDVTWAVWIWDPVTSTTLCSLDNSSDPTRFTFVSA